MESMLVKFKCFSDAWGAQDARRMKKIIWVGQVSSEYNFSEMQQRRLGTFKTSLSELDDERDY